MPRAPVALALNPLAAPVISASRWPLSREFSLALVRVSSRTRLVARAEIALSSFFGPASQRAGACFGPGPERRDDHNNDDDCAGSRSAPSHCTRFRAQNNAEPA